MTNNMLQDFLCSTFYAHGKNTLLKKSKTSTVRITQHKCNETNLYIQSKFQVREV